MTSYGLDFGTTNSALSIRTGDSVKLLPLDSHASSPEVIRSALYFHHQPIDFDDTVTALQKIKQTYDIKQVTFKGTTKTIFGSRAISRYLRDNTNRAPGITRRFYTGKTIEVILFTTQGGTQKTENIQEYFDETDYGTGRLFHSLKTALKSPSFKGVTLHGHFYTLEELISRFIISLKRKADMIVGETVETIKVGRPVIFHDNKQSDKFAEDRLKQALILAGFKHITFEYEPVAAAKCFFQKNHTAQTVLIFDFGGGTLDTTIVRKGEIGHEVLAVDGAYIGGDLLNSDILYHKVAPYFGSKATWGDKQMPFPVGIYSDMRDWYSFSNINNPDNINFLTGPARYRHSNPLAISRLLHLVKMNLGYELYEAIETAKKELTFSDSTFIDLSSGPINLHQKITKHEFESLISPRIDSIQEAVERTLVNAKLEPSQIDKVVTTGGSSLLPIVNRTLSGLFGKEKLYSFDLFTSIASGLS